MNKPGRNDACSCGSGKKYKKCCALKERRTSPALMLTVGGALLAAIIFGLVQFTSERESPPPGRVWSAEHGHYH